MADAGGGKSGHDSHGSYDGVLMGASFGPQSQSIVISSGQSAKKKRDDLKKRRKEQEEEEEAKKEAEEKAKEGR
jgi:hypothetical protein